MIKPLNDYIVAEEIPEDEKTPSGLVIKTKQEKPKRAKVVAAGPGKTLDNGLVRGMTVKVGDTVMVGRQAGTPIKIDEKEYIVLTEQEVFGIL